MVRAASHRRLGDAGLFWSLAGLGAVLALFFTWRRSRRPPPLPAAPFTPNPPQTVVGAELNVTDALVQGAIDHEHAEDLSRAVPDVDVAKPLVGPPQPPDETPHEARRAQLEEETRDWPS